MINDIPRLYGPDGQPIVKFKEQNHPAILITTGKQFYSQLNKYVQVEGSYWPTLCKEFGGRLEKDIACHALFSYAIRAKKMQEDNGPIEQRIQLDNEPWPEELYVPIYKSTMFTYCLTHEDMVKFWFNIDFQFEQLEIGKLPGEFRFNKQVEIN
jgi:hypothetical protein